MCVAGTVVPLGRLMDALIGLGVEWYKSGEQIIWSVTPVSRRQYEVEFGLEVTELQYIYIYWFKCKLNFTRKVRGGDKVNSWLDIILIGRIGLN